jgi:hypothetical protein
MRPKSIITALTICLISATLAACVITPKTTSDVPAIAVNRYSEMPLSEYESRVMDEATKLSYACRMFRYLYGKWPANINEIKSRTNGIDYDVFRGRATIAPTENDSAEIAIFDGENVRSVQATPIDFHLSDSVREQSQSSKFKIDVGAVNSHGS